MKIDAHHHLWRYSSREYGWIGTAMGPLRRDFLLDELTTAAQQTGIDGTVVVQARQTVEETDWLLDQADASPLLRGVVGWAPLASAELPALLKRWQCRGKLKGLRHVIQDEPDEQFMRDKKFNAGIAALLDTGLVYDLLVSSRQLPQASELVRRHPKQVFILDHLAKPNIRDKEVQPWRDHLFRLAESENVHCKLSGLVNEADWSDWSPEQLYPYLDAALHAFGAERLLAGSDWPVCLLAVSYKRWWDVLSTWTSSLSSRQQEQIMGETARAVYRLS